ncbi:hypothetical protein GCM10020358_55920 [Amorphoplanes nipponensis]|uniref:Uncharacterized protein n=1 Tax=Actinoplanes nipponensis TaxID=135950 RepID=A0A919JJ12_9ACTN|nr:hypothetical protein [Actinoplanes nipponensis]GIE51914.1 hypothetical protein Ani05nite_54480 [Actinoplanes nipponensis]
MTEPYWGVDADWAGLLLLIVPVGQLSVPAGELAQLVRDRIESDAALYDVVTVAHAPSPTEFAAPADWHRALRASLIRAAVPDGHFLAPRAIFVTISVGETEEDARQGMGQLHDDGPFNRISVIRYGTGIRRDSQGGGIAPATIRTIARAASKSIAAYEQNPELAIGERDFQAEVVRLVQQGLLDRQDFAVAWPSPRPAPRMGTATLTQAPRQQRSPAPTPPVTPAPAPASTQALGLPQPPPSLQPQAPVFHHAGDIVQVDSRSALSRLRGPEPTDAYAIERLARSIDAVSLAYFVVVPDEDSSARKVGREHRSLARSLDRLLADVGGDALTGRRMRVAAEVVAALDPLRRYGVLRPAGDLTEDDVPKVRAELFDHAKTVEGLLGAAQRTAVAFQARGVDVLSLHFIFFSSVALLDANTSGADWDRLLEHARVTWIDIGPSGQADNREPPEILPSPFGFHFVSDRYDVPTLIREESAILYRYRPPAPPQPVAREAPSASEKMAESSGGRRGWLPRLRRRADRS